jgi:hypothetical protein
VFNWLKKKNSAGPDFSALDSNEKVKAAAAAESPRLLRRLNTLRGLSHEEDEQVLARGA